MVQDIVRKKLDEFNGKRNIYMREIDRRKKLCDQLVEGVVVQIVKDYKFFYNAVDDILGKDRIGVEFPLRDGKVYFEDKYQVSSRVEKVKDDEIFNVEHVHFCGDVRGDIDRSGLSYKGKYVTNMSVSEFEEAITFFYKEVDDFLCKLIDRLYTIISRLIDDQTEEVVKKTKSILGNDEQIKKV